MSLQIDGQLFEIGEVNVTSRAKKRCIRMQKAFAARRGSVIPPDREDELVSVHVAILLKLHATGQYGNVKHTDKAINHNNITKNEGRVLSIIGTKQPFIVMTTLPLGDTVIATQEEV